MRYQLVGLYLGLALSLISCHASALKPTPVLETNMPAATIITFNGKVVYQKLEGGFWGLIDEAGQHYVPEALAPTFQHTGLRVRVRATLAEKTFGIQMWGTRIRLLDIERIEGSPP